MEMYFIFCKNEERRSNQDNLREMPESALKSSVSQSGFICQTKTNNSMGSQVNFHHIYKPPVKMMKLCTRKIKAALVDVSVRAQISPEKARKEVQTFSKNVMVTITIFRIKNLEEAPKMPKTAEDYADHADIFSD